MVVRRKTPRRILEDGVRVASLFDGHELGESSVNRFSFSGGGSFFSGMMRGLREQMESELSSELGVTIADLSYLAAHAHTMIETEDETLRRGIVTLAYLRSRDAILGIDKLIALARKDPSEDVRQAALFAVGISIFDRPNEVAVQFLKEIAVDASGESGSRSLVILLLVSRYNRKILNEINAYDELPIDLDLKEVEKMIASHDRKLAEIIEKITE